MMPIDYLENKKAATRTSGVRGILHPCSSPGCSALTNDARCEIHCREHQRELDDYRGSPSARGYDAVWRRMRRAKLATDPFCQIQTNCPGHPATEVDHIIPLREWPEGRLEWNNLQSACRPCHSAKTMRERVQARKKMVRPGVGRSESSGAR